ncbi:MAG TPA: DUF2089 domain-containing protein [Ktedonobacterales bacterium]|nr:DUF2089 domain-containing protein [Ktedonobacterales bacterium]
MSHPSQQGEASGERHTHSQRQLHDFNGVCPICGGAMVVTRLTCGQCGSALEGAFRLNDAGASPVGAAREGQFTAQIAARFGRLARLDRSQLAFVEVFLQSRGVIKNVEDMLGISYPTVKARLASVLEAMGYSADDEPAVADVRQRRRQILAELSAGRITSEEALQRLADASIPQTADEPDTSI